MKKLFLIFSYLLLVIPFAAKADVSLVELAKKVRPAVVLIETFDENNRPVQQASGFFISAKGYLVTNHHVIEGAYSAIITTVGGEQFLIKGIIAKDAEADVVELLVNVGGSKVSVLELVDVLPSVGEDIAVVGNPFGLESTLSKGIVSAVREIPSFGHILQISAPISQGSSGSPLLNMKRQVIGVATFIVSEGQALNFAIPSKKILSLKREKILTSLPEYANELIDKEKDEVEKLYKAGWKKVLGGEWIEALGYFERVIQEKPNHEFAHFSLGFVYNILGRNEEAIQSYKRSIAINPDDPDNYYFLGEAYSDSGRYKEAVQAYKQAIAINPDDADTHYSLGLVYCIMGDTVSALGEYLILMDLDEEMAVRLSNLISEKETLLSSEDVDTTEPYAYHNSQGHFSFTLPAGWEEIPKEVIDLYLKTVQEQSPQPLALSYDAAFQKISTSYFAYPYLFVQIHQDGPWPKDKIQKLVSTGEWKESLERGIDTVEDSLLDMLRISEIGQTTYDTERNIILSKMDSEVVGVGKVSAMTAIILSRYGAVVLFWYSTADSFDSNLDYFNQMIDSFRYDVGYEYRRAAKDDYIAKNDSSGSLLFKGFIVFIFGVLATVIIIVIARRSTHSLASIETPVNKNMIEDSVQAGRDEKLRQGQQIRTLVDMNLAKTENQHMEIATWEMKVCANCEREIGRLEKTFLFNGSIICFECYKRLKEPTV